MGRLRLCGLVVVCIAVAGWCRTAAAQLYMLNDLGLTVDGQWMAEARAINNNGQIVGVLAGPGSSTDHAGMWSPGKGLFAVEPDALHESAAWDINDAASAVGVSDGFAPEGAFVWTGQAGMQYLGTLPGFTTSTARAVSNQDHVVGYAGSLVSGQAFLWTKQDGLIDLGNLLGDREFSVATGVNDVGAVVGYSSMGARRTAFLWTQEDGFTDLGDFPGGGFHLSSANDINNAGQVAGYGLGNGYRAFLWTEAKGLIALDTADASGGIANYANSINEQGHIVGNLIRVDVSANPVIGNSASETSTEFIIIGPPPPPTKSFAMLWTPELGMLDLNSLVGDAAKGWHLAEAFDINDAGQIVGIGRDPAGVERAFLLTPVPEPSTGLLLGSGTLLAGWFAMCSRRRQQRDETARTASRGMV